MEMDINDLILDDEPMEAYVDKEYYLLALGDDFPCDDDADVNAHNDALSKAIDKTIEEYRVNGKVKVEDWDIFDEDLCYNAQIELEKIYGEY